jgi:drug/metabolite transporter (DMT)-like permease
MLLSLLPTMLANVVAPAVAYSQIRPHVAGNAVALLAAMAIPAAYTLVIAAWRRRADPLALLSAAGFGIALAASYLAGGSALAVELQDPAETGALGLACLVSVIAGRPLWLLVLRLVARRNAQAARMLADPATRRTATVETVIIGAIFLVHAIAITILALTVSPGTFVALSRPVGLPLLGAGVAVLVWYRRRRRARRRRDDRPS